MVPDVGHTSLDCVLEGILSEREEGDQRIYHRLPHIKAELSESDGDVNCPRNWEQGDSTSLLLAIKTELPDSCTDDLTGSSPVVMSVTAGTNTSAISTFCANTSLQCSAVQCSAVTSGE